MPTQSQADAQPTYGSSRDSGSPDRRATVLSFTAYAVAALTQIATWPIETDSRGARWYNAPDGDLDRRVVVQLFTLWHELIAPLQSYPRDLSIEDREAWFHDTYPDADERVELCMECGLISGTIGCAFGERLGKRVRERAVLDSLGALQRLCRWINRDAATPTPDVTSAGPLSLTTAPHATPERPAASA